MIRLQIGIMVELRRSIDIVRNWIENPECSYNELNTTLPARPISEAAISKIDRLPLGIMTVLTNYEGVVQANQLLLDRHPIEIKLNDGSIKKLLGDLLETLQAYHDAMKEASIVEKPYIILQT